MSRFIVSVLKLVSASFIAQIISVLLLPVVTRLYAPADFGIYQIILSLGSIIVLIAPLSYNFAIVLPEKDEDGFSLLIISMICVGITTIVSGLLLFFVLDSLGSLLNVNGLSAYFLFLILFILFQALFNVQNYWLLRMQKFNSIGLARISNALVTKTVQIGYGIFAASPLGLISGSIVGFFSGCYIMSHEVRKCLNILKNIHFYDIKRLAFRYRKFPFFHTGSLLINELSFQIAPFILAFFFNPVIVGYYSFAYLTVNLPTSLIGRSVQQVFFQKASSQKIKKQDLSYISLEIQKRLISIGIFPVIILFFIAEIVFEIVFGAEWGTAGAYARILAPWLFLTLLNLPLMSIFSILERQEMSFFFQIILLIGRFLALIVGGLSGDPIITLILFSFTGIFSNGLINVYIMKLTRVRIADVAKIFLKYVLIAVSVSIPLFVVKLLQMGDIVILVVGGCVTMVYYVVVIKEDDFLRSQITQILKRVRKH